MDGSGKHSSPLLYRNNYGRKCYSIRAWGQSGKTFMHLIYQIKRCQQGANNLLVKHDKHSSLLHNMLHL